MAVSENLSERGQELENGTPTETGKQSNKRQENPLSEREMDVARLLATGASNGEIAHGLSISPHTVKVHLRNIFEKLGVNSRTEASMVLVQRGWIAVQGVDPDEESTDSYSVVEPKLRSADDASKAPTEEAATQVIQPSQTLPEPAPLYHQPAVPSMWQRLYLLAGIIVTVLSFFSANLFGDAQPTPDLLSDKGSPVIGKPALADTPRWTSRSPLFEPRSRMAVAQIGDKVFIIGGERPGGEIVSNVDMYDLSINEWSMSVPLPTPLANATATVLDNYVYVAGGSYSLDPQEDGPPEISNILWRLSLDPDEHTPVGLWEEAGNLPAPLTGGAIIAAEEALYYIGGWNGQAMSSEVWRYVPSQGSDTNIAAWDLVNHLELPRAFFGAVYFQEKIYIVGGHDGQRELDRADAYDPKAGTWTRLPPLVTPRGGLTLATDNRSIFAFGGGWDSSVTTHERFDLTTKLWSNFPSPVPGEWRHMAAFSFRNNLYLVGGWSGDYLDVHLQYENLFTRTLLPLIGTD